MKIIQIFLLILIILGVVLLFTQKFWLEPLVLAIMQYDEVSETIVLPEVVPVTSDVGMNGWDWVFSDVSAQGTQFMYPNTLPTKYVTAVDWPPTVEMTTGEFSCAEGDMGTEDGGFSSSGQRVIDGRTYCVRTTDEGAAGSTYTTYGYSTLQGDFLVRVAFTLRTPQCLNYDEPEQSACQAEQASFDTDALADNIATSIRMQ